MGLCGDFHGSPLYALTLTLELQASLSGTQDTIMDEVDTVACTGTLVLPVEHDLVSNVFPHKDTHIISWNL